MAKKKIVWSLRAQQDRIEILDYWIDRNKSKTYSEKLFKLFQESSKIISEHPEIGKPTSMENVRVKVVRDYLMVYEVKLDKIEILLIWDSRQDPNRLEKQLKKKN